MGRWTTSNVREVLTQPKYTGYMVWNRRATKTRGGRVNPIEQWVWSPQPTHEAIIDLDTFISAQQVAGPRERSRASAGPNHRHPQTKRSYRLRSYLYCQLCGRRMFGKTRRQHSYYACAPKREYIPAGHPASLWVREAVLLDGLHRFLADRVFGAYRHALLAAELPQIDRRAAVERDQRAASLRTAMADVESRRKRLVHLLELDDNPGRSDHELIREVAARRAELAAEHDSLSAELATLEQQQPTDRPNPGLLDELPVGACDLDGLPEELARRLFEALRLEIHYNKATNTVTYRVTLIGETIPTLQQATDGVVAPTRPPNDTPTTSAAPTTNTATTVPICVVPPAGFEPATLRLGGGCSIP